VNTGSTCQSHEPVRYSIRVQGRLDARWSAWFDGMTLTAGTDGTTVMEGLVVDQAALHGLLARIRDLGIPLLSMVPLAATDPAPVPPPPAANPTSAATAQPRSQP
jgi:hypothetical protein